MKKNTREKLKKKECREKKNKRNKNENFLITNETSTKNVD